MFILSLHHGTLSGRLTPVIVPTLLFSVRPPSLRGYVFKSVESAWLTTRPCITIKTNCEQLVSGFCMAFNNPFQCFVVSFFHYCSSQVAWWPSMQHANKVTNAFFLPPYQTTPMVWALQFVWSVAGTLYLCRFGSVQQVQADFSAELVTLPLF